MASLQSSSLCVFSSSSFSSFPSRKVNAAIHVPKLQKAPLSIPRLPIRNNILVEEFNRIDRFTTIPLKEEKKDTIAIDESYKSATSKSTAEIYMILEAIADRVEMHKNIGEQRNNWNSLLLNSINMITLTASTMAGIAATGHVGMPILGLKLSSTCLFLAATGILAVMNKIQPSQLVEEQRNAERLFRQLQNEIHTILALRSPTKTDVKVMMEKVLALDKAYPLPLLGTMLEKFPETFKPASWWPRKNSQKLITSRNDKLHRAKIDKNDNGWSEKLESEMKQIVGVIKRKDMEDYIRLGNKALKINKILALSGPLLTGLAAIASPFIGSSSNFGSLAVIVSVLGGALASTVNTLEHAGQVGMVFEMYRNCGGFFQLLEETIESTLEETDVEKRENGELFEMKVALQLGRSLSQMRELASKSTTSQREGVDDIDEFASKLF